MILIKYEIFTLLLVLALSLTIMPVVTAAQTPYNIWLQKSNTGFQSWAYYPYDPVHPWTGGKWSPPNTGTSNFVVLPGTDIARKIIIHSDLPAPDYVNFRVTGLPSSWVVKYTSPTTINSLNFKRGLGYASFYVIVPSSAAPGTYSYTITARSGSGKTSSIADSIVVGKAPPKNLLINPGFENDLGAWTNISLNIPQLGPGGVAKVTMNDSYGGLSSLCLYCGPGSQDYEQHQPYAAVFQHIDVQQSDTVTLTFWSKGDAFKMFFGTFDDPFSPWAAVDVPGSDDWTYHTLTWDYSGYPESQYFMYGIIPYVSEGHKIFIDDLNATVSN
jgi:hypothetical protein